MLDIKLNHVPPVDNYSPSPLLDNEDNFSNLLDNREYVNFNNNSLKTESVTTVKSMPWINTQSKINTKKNQIKIKIINEIFYNCLPIIEDPYWKDLFSLAAHGKLPKDFLFKNNTLIFRRYNQCDKIELSENIYEVVTECINFFQTRGGIKSEINLCDEKSNNKKYIKNISEWKSVKNGNTKKILISNFIITLAKKYNLSEEQKDQLKFFFL